MTPDIDDQLRSRLRGAASGAPIDLGVPDGDVLVRGRRVVVRRRVLTAAGAAAATLVVAGTIGILAPRPGDGDALPALPTPTTTPTPEVTPTVTPSASVTATPTAAPTAIVTPTATPTRTGEPEPSSTPTPSSSAGSRSTPEASPTSTPTSATTEWTAYQRIGDGSFRMRIVEETPVGGQRVFAADLDSPDYQIQSSLGIEEQAPDATRLTVADVDLKVVLTSFAVVDVVSDDGEPVAGESIGRFSLTSPLTGKPVRFTVVTMPRPVTMAAPLAAKSLTLRLADGSVIAYEDGRVTPQSAG